MIAKEEKVSKKPTNQDYLKYSYFKTRSLKKGRLNLNITNASNDMEEKFVYDSSRLNDKSISKGSLP